MSDHDKWMDAAYRLAEEALNHLEVPIGAIVVKDDKIIGRGYNLRETRKDPVAHAEILAIQDAVQTLGNWRLTDCIMYTTLEPCPMCLGAAQQSRLKSIFYGAKDQKGGAISLGYLLHEDKRINHRFQAHHVAHQASGEIISNFFKQIRNK